MVIGISERTGKTYDADGKTRTALGFEMELLDTAIELAADFASFGAVRSGSLVVRGPLLLVEWKRGHSPYHDEVRPPYTIQTPRITSPF